MGPGCVVYQLRYVFKFKLGNCSALGVTNMCLDWFRIEQVFEIIFICLTLLLCDLNFDNVACPTLDSDYISQPGTDSITGFNF